MKDSLREFHVNETVFEMQSVAAHSRQVTHESGYALCASPQGMAVMNEGPSMMVRGTHPTTLHF
jgi:hypothetical protein